MHNKIHFNFYKIINHNDFGEEDFLKLQVKNIWKKDEFVNTLVLSDFFTDVNIVFLSKTATIKTLKNNKEIEEYDVIVRVDDLPVGVELEDKNSSLAFVGKIDFKKSYIDVTNIIKTNLINNNFETKFKGIEVKCEKNIQVSRANLDNFLTETLFTAENIKKINVLHSNFENFIQQWERYFDFSEKLTSYRKNNSFVYDLISKQQFIKLNKDQWNRIPEPIQINIKNQKIQKMITNNNFIFVPISWKNEISKLKIEFSIIWVASMYLNYNLENINYFIKSDEVILAPLDINISKNKSFFNVDGFVFSDEFFEKNKSLITRSDGAIKLITKLDNFNVNSYQQSFMEKLKLPVTTNLPKFKTAVFYTEINEEDFNKVIPEIGYLAFPSTGESALINRGKTVISRVKSNKVTNPFLINFLFNSANIECLSQKTIDPNDLDFYSNLSVTQKENIIKALKNNDIFVLQGPPGTGKTQFITELVHKFNKQGKKVLISSQNHTAIDNVLERLPIIPSISPVKLSKKFGKDKQASQFFSASNVVLNFYKAIDNMLDIKIEKKNVFINEKAENLKSMTSLKKDSNIAAVIFKDIKTLEKSDAKELLLKNNIEKSLQALKGYFNDSNKIIDKGLFSLEVIKVLSLANEKTFKGVQLKTFEDVLTELTLEKVLQLFTNVYVLSYINRLDENRKQIKNFINQKKDLQKNITSKINHNILEYLTKNNLLKEVSVKNLKDLNIFIDKEITRLTAKDKNVENTTQNIDYKKIKNYLNNNYDLDFNVIKGEVVDNKQQSSAKDVLEYSNSFIKDYTNVYAITATSNNLFKQEKNKELLAANIDSIDIAKMYFDVVIIDEASKLTPIEILMPIIFGKTTILVGDYRQLPPILPIRQEDVELINEIHGEDFNYSEFKKMFEESMFKNIISSANSTISGILLEQYRSNEDIMKIVNNFYNNKLKLGTKNQNFDLRHTISVKNQKGLTIFEPNKSIYWLDSSTDLHGKIVIEDRAYNSTSLSNVFEINLIKNSLLKIQESLKPTEKITIAIISFYKKQITALKHELNKINLKNIKLNISTVDDFQGKEADHVFVSLVRRPRDTSKMDASFIEKYERINVAFSRAKKMLVIVGALDFYKNLEIPMPDFNDPMKQTKVDVYKRIAKIINTYGIIHEAHNILEEN